MIEPRPKIQLILSPFDKIIEKIGWILLTFLWGFTFYAYFILPEIIPTHFNIKGQVDAVGTKIFIFMFPVLGMVVFFGLTFVNQYPHIFNYPTSITVQNAEQQYRNATRLIRFLKLFIILIFSIITIVIYYKAM